MELKDSLKKNPVKKAKELAKEAREQAGEAGAKARARSGASVQISKGDASFSAGAHPFHSKYSHDLQVDRRAWGGWNRGYWQ